MYVNISILNAVDAKRFSVVWTITDGQKERRKDRERGKERPRTSQDTLYPCILRTSWNDGLRIAIGNNNNI